MIVCFLRCGTVNIKATNLTIQTVEFVRLSGSEMWMMKMKLDSEGTTDTKKRQT